MKDDPILGDLFDKLIEMRTGTDWDVYLYGVPEHLRKKKTSEKKQEGEKSRDRNL